MVSPEILPAHVVVQMIWHYSVSSVEREAYNVQQTTDRYLLSPGLTPSERYHPGPLGVPWHYSSDTVPAPSLIEPAPDSSPHTSLPNAGTPPPLRTTQTVPAIGAPATLPGSSRAAYTAGGPRLWPGTDLLHSQAPRSGARDSASDNTPRPPRPRHCTTGPSGPDRSRSPHRRRRSAVADYPSGSHDAEIQIPPLVPVESWRQTTLVVGIGKNMYGVPRIGCVLGHLPLSAVALDYRAMLFEIASHLNPERPGRLEPRAICRDHKHYPSLRVTRAQWKARHAA
jgi:hypothetical protein